MDLPQELLTGASIVVVECLLSLDNALLLASVARSRLQDPAEQAQALIYGMWGAYAFRLLLILIGVEMFQNPWFRALCAVYLVRLGLSHLFAQTPKGRREVSGPSRLPLSPFWATVVQLECLDLVFSIDSVSAALALSTSRWVLVVAAFVSVLSVRLAASALSKVLGRYPRLQPASMAIASLVGVHLLLGVGTLSIGSVSWTLDYQLPKAVLFTGLFGILGVALGLDVWQRGKGLPPQASR